VKVKCSHLRTYSQAYAVHDRIYPQHPGRLQNLANNRKGLHFSSQQRARKVTNLNNYNPISGHVSVMSSESRLVAERHSVLPQPYRTLFMIIEVSPSTRDVQISIPTNPVDLNSQQLSSQPW
jgi:hypothetical protein